MPVIDGIEGAELLADLLDRPVSPPARLALLYCLMRFSAEPGLSVAPERHGVMASLAVHGGGDWLYAVAPARHWALAYIRPPALRRGLSSFERLAAVLPHATRPQPDHCSVRLHDPTEAGLFCDLVLARE